MYNSGALIPAFATGLHRAGKNTFSLWLVVIIFLRGLLFNSRKYNEIVWAFSVGGADYGSVRIGAFMGRRIIQCTAAKECEGLKALATAAEEVEDPEYALSQADANEQYLCNIPPHRYRSILNFQCSQLFPIEDFI